MKRLSGRRLQVLWVLSIMVPIGLLSAFRLTGIIQEPPEPETILIDPVVWNYERPSGFVRIEEYIINTCQTNQVSAEIGVTMGYYLENDLWAPFNYRDGIEFSVTVNVVGVQSSASSILVNFSPTDANASIYVDKTFLITYNASLLGMKQFGTNASEAFVNAKTSGSSSSGRDYEDYWAWRIREGWMLSNKSLSGLEIKAYWVFDDENFQDHQLKVSVEVTYSDGAITRKIILPILLEVPREIEPKLVFSTTTAVNSLGVDDQEDLYKFRVEVSTNATIHVAMNPAPNADFDLELRDANNNLVIPSNNRGPGLIEAIDYVVYETRDWYVRVVYYPLSENGLYSLQISVNHPCDGNNGGGG